MPKRYSPEGQERAVRMVFEHEAEHPSQWAAMESIASKIGCTAETLRSWVRQAERDAGRRAGLSSEERDLDAVAATLNSRPRKTLNWKTPAEALDELLSSAQQAGVATTP